MKEYFNFFEEAILVEGNSQVSIYNLLDGKIYLFSEKESVDIIKLYQGTPIDVVGLCSKKLINNLTEANLGCISNTFLPKMDIVKPEYWKDMQFFKTSSRVQRAFIIMGYHCKKDCDYCTNSEIFFENRCMSCHRNKNSNPTMREISIFIKTIEIMDCREIWLVGGDILYDAIFLDQLFSYISPEVTVNLIWGFQKISEEKIYKQLKRIQRFIIEVTPEDTYCKAFQEFRNKSKDIIKSLSIIQPPDSCIDENHLLSLESDFQVIYNNRLIKKEDLGQIIASEDKEICNTGINEFLYKEMYHTCMNGLVSLTENGIISVCPMMEKTTIGTVDNIETALKAENLNQYWRLSKAKINNCKDCALRYTCNDCRYTGQYISHDLAGMYECKKKSRLSTQVV